MRPKLRTAPAIPAARSVLSLASNQKKVGASRKPRGARRKSSAGSRPWRAQEVLCGKQTLAPEEQRRLREEGEKGDQEDDAQ